MSYTRIEPSLMNRKIKIMRKVTTKDDIGGILETWTTTYNMIKCFISERLTSEKIEVYGREAKKIHTAYLQSKDNGVQVIIHEEDRIFNYENNVTYRVVSVNRNFNANANIHHHEVDIEAVREKATERQSDMILAKARIE